MVKLCKQIRRHFAQGVDQHVQTTAVGHADHDFLHALGASLLNQLVHGSNETLTAFQGEALLPHVLGVQKTLQAFGGGQPLENVLLFVGIELGFTANAFELLLPPALLVLVGGVHVLGTDRAAVGLTQRVHQLTQAHRLFAEEGVAGVEHGFLIGVIKAVERQFEFRNIVALGALEWVKVSPSGAHIAVGSDQLLHCSALSAHFGVGPGGHHDVFQALLGTLRERIDHRQVGNVFGAATVYGRHMLQSIEVITPGIWNTAWIGQVVFIHLFNVWGVTAKQIGIVLVRLVHRRCTVRPGGRCLTHIPLTSVPLRGTLAG